MSSALKDTRRHKRFTVDVAAVIHTADGQRVDARTRDLSRSGICVITAEAVPRGGAVVIELSLAFGANAFSEPLHLDAHVVWCTPIGDSYQVGAMFDRLTEEQDGFVEMFLHFLDGTLAPRGVDGMEDDNDEPPVPPDVKDDPFRS